MPDPFEEWDAFHPILLERLDDLLAAIDARPTDEVVRKITALITLLRPRKERYAGEQEMLEEELKRAADCVVYVGTETARELLLDLRDSAEEWW